MMRVAYNCDITPIFFHWVLYIFQILDISSSVAVAERASKMRCKMLKKNARYFLFNYLNLSNICHIFTMYFFLLFRFRIFIDLRYIIEDFYKFDALFVKYRLSSPPSDIRFLYKWHVNIRKPEIHPCSR